MIKYKSCIYGIRIDWLLISHFHVDGFHRAVVPNDIINADGPTPGRHQGRRGISIQVVFRRVRSG